MNQTNALLDRVSETIDTFIANNDAFRDACDLCFASADKDGNGVLSVSELSSHVDKMFNDLEDALDTAQIKVERPSKQKIDSLLESADVNGDDRLDEEEFFEFYRQVLKLAAFNSARGFVAKHGAALVAAAASAFAMHTGTKKIEIPEDLKPLMQYATPLVSIAAAVLAKYGITIKTKNTAEKKLLRCENFKKPKSD